MNIERRKEVDLACYYRHHAEYKEKARLRARTMRAARAATETPEQRKARLEYHRAHYLKHRTPEVAAKAAESEFTIPSTEIGRFQMKMIMIALLAKEYKSFLAKKNEWKRKKYGRKPRVPAAVKPPKAPKVKLTEEERRQRLLESRRAYTKRPEVRERINAAKRNYSKQALEAARGNPEALAELRAKRRKAFYGWVDKMRENDPERYAAYRAKLTAGEMKKRQQDPQRRIGCILRHKLYISLRRQQAGKFSSTLDLVGCSVRQLMSHLEAQFEPGMNWSNYGRGIGKWTIDHVVPCASVDLTIPENQQKIFNWKNLRPMWFVENCSKSSTHNGKTWRHSDHGNKSFPLEVTVKSE